jgi:cystathionine beta-lyase
VAQWLQTRSEVQSVLHPALPDFAGHTIWKRDFKGSSGVFSFVLDADEGRGKEVANAFLDALQIFGLGYSWGGYESLALPVSLADRTIAKGPQSGALIRLQIGLEDVEDLKKDLDRGFAAVAAL